MTPDNEKIIAELVNKGLDGDMDAVNSHDDKMVRAKVKATIMKVNKGTAERPPMPKVVFEEVAQIGDEKDSEQVDIDKNAHNKVRELLLEKFPDSLIENEHNNYIQIKAKNWYEIAVMLKTDKSLLFDSLQCQMGGRTCHSFHGCWWCSNHNRQNHRHKSGYGCRHSV